MEFKLKKETKGKLVFEEQVEDGEYPSIGSLYVSKVAAKQLGIVDRCIVELRAP